MDVLKNKEQKAYDYLSRYTPFYYYYNSRDGKYIYGITAQLRTSTPFVEHDVEQRDTLDSLSLKYYGRPDLYWVIADFNRIKDPFERLWGNHKTINVPTLGAVAYGSR